MKILVIGLAIILLASGAAFYIFWQSDTGTAIKELGEERENARDLRRKADMNQISLAMEMDYIRNGKYYQSSGPGAPLKIPCSNTGCTAAGDGLELDPFPKDPQGTSYYWIDNTHDRQNFCVYVALEEGGFFAASSAGTKEIANKPRTLADCGTL